MELLFFLISYFLRESVQLTRFLRESVQLTRLAQSGNICSV